MEATDMPEEKSGRRHVAGSTGSRLGERTPRSIGEEPGNLWGGVVFPGLGAVFEKGPFRTKHGKGCKSGSKTETSKVEQANLSMVTERGV